MPGNNKILSFLGIARKADRLFAGMDAVAESLKNGKACLLIIAEDISQRSAERLIRMAKEKNIPTRRLRGTIAELSTAIGKKAGIVAVADKGFTKRLLELFQEQSTADKEGAETEKRSNYGEEYAI